jgi:predicted RNase H-like HicB family nuclease
MMAGGWHGPVAATGSTTREQTRHGHGGRQAELRRSSWNIECHTEASWPQEGEVKMAMRRYMVVVERGETSWGAHAPDLPGCVAVGETREEVLRLIPEAIEFHIDGLKQDGLPVPAPSSEGEFIEVGAA